MQADLRTSVTFQWTRIIDSFGSNQADEAAFSELPNGDDLETGTFAKDGIPTAYEEIWRDVTETSAAESPAWILQSNDGLTFLGRIGRVFLGMRQGEDGSFGVRKEVIDDSKGWEIVYETGPTQSIPRARDVLQEESTIVEATTGGAAVVGGGRYAVRGLHSPNTLPSRVSSRLRRPTTRKVGSNQ